MLGHLESCWITPLESQFYRIALKKETTKMATVEEGVQIYVDTINHAVTAANLTRPEECMLKWRETNKYYKIERESGGAPALLVRLVLLFGELAVVSVSRCTIGKQGVAHRLASYGLILRYRCNTSITSTSATSMKRARRGIASYRIEGSP